MRRLLLLLMIMFGIAGSGFAAVGSALDGDWTGKLNVGNGASLKLVFHISANPDLVVMDSPDQGAFGIETETLLLSADSLSIRVPKLMMSYEGHLKDGKIEGIFRQGLASLPLSLERGEARVVRPQTPVPPYPYSTEEVRIENEAGESVLAGTLTLPEGYDSTTPVVVLVSGSGLQNRDEEVFGHRPFAVIADYLARGGVASLRYDDRGCGESAGDAFNATTDDFASDAAAVVDWLRNGKRFGRVGLLGHSEGGQIAYKLAASCQSPDFIVSIAGPAIRGTETIAYQNKVSLLNSGVSEEKASAFASALERALEKKLTEPEGRMLSDAELAELYPEYTENEVARQLGESIRSAYASKGDNAWMMYFLGYDPAEDMGKMKVPAMLVYGELDRQVPASLNAVRAQELAPSAAVKVYPGLNHLMQHAKTGNVAEYAEIEETISPELLSDILTFIRQAAGNRLLLKY